MIHILFIPPRQGSFSSCFSPVGVSWVQSPTIKETHLGWYGAKDLRKFGEWFPHAFFVLCQNKGIEGH